MTSGSSLLATLLPPDTDSDVLEYLAGTVEQCIEDGDVSIAGLTEALSELLVSYELAEDEMAAAGMCEKLHVQLASSVPASADEPTSSDAPLALLSAPVQMGVDNERVDMASVVGSQGEMDAFGNRMSAVAQANAKWRPTSLVKASTAHEEEEVDEDAGGVHIGLLDMQLRGAELRKREAAEALQAEQARERACGLYLDSKMAGGSRDVTIKSLILLAPHGKPLIEDGAALRLTEGRKYGLVGRNGTGKTTLLKAISTYEITGFPAHLKVVHVEQDPALDLSRSALQTVLGFDLEGKVGASAPSQLPSQLPLHSCLHHCHLSHLHSRPHMCFQSSLSH